MSYGMMPGLDAYFGKLLTFKYRGSLNIVADILDQIKRDPKGKPKTQIMEDARLSYKQLNKYLDLLLLCDFIVGKNSRYGDQQITRYILTEQGLGMVQQLQRLYFAWSLIHAST